MKKKERMRAVKNFNNQNNTQKKKKKKTLEMNEIIVKAINKLQVAVNEISDQYIIKQLQPPTPLLSATAVAATAASK